VANHPSGADVTGSIFPREKSFDYGPPPADHTSDVNNKAKVFSGRYGADRNANGLLDRGNVRPSVRLRALTIARYNFYDMRVPCLFR
jgi:hypothetical protein